ncbi:hypothetical protein ZIOFF_047857 [Zingiber officinale]|uniref:Uncharacterized protein n=1 Tax=Zingiber officinale TaxID=94328 RepID=A0A8J5KRI3_ZINOF|nr:hypothetical protein ZIOFF_047853 [Zingiber officinale]KAG6492887.1 hypothetical protein ZIOFF_047857 [Zingiber officinale]
MPALDLSTLTIDSSSPCPRIATAVHLIATRRHLIVGCHCHRREFRHKGRWVCSLLSLRIGQTKGGCHWRDPCCGAIELFPYHTDPFTGVILCLMKCLVPFVVSVRVVNVVIGYHLPWVVLGSVVLVRNQAQ